MPHALKKYYIVFIMLFFLSNYSFSQITRDPLIEHFQNATISLGIIDSTFIINNGGIDYTKKIPYYRILGTGVIFYVNTKKGSAYVVVTAKHVVSDIGQSNELRYRSSKDDSKSIYDFLGYPLTTIYNGRNLIYSPSDTNIDLACFLFHSRDSLGNFTDITPVIYRMVADSSSYFEGAEVYTLGYPGAVGLDYWTRALVRAGIIAWIPSKNIESKKFLIDCNIFPGNSGGPVFRKPSTFILGDTTENTLFQQQSFLGIVIQRRFSPNSVTEQRTGKPILSSIGSQLTSYESIGIGVVEPAGNVVRMLKEYEYCLNHKYLYWIE